MNKFLPQYIIEDIVNNTNNEEKTKNNKILNDLLYNLFSPKILPKNKINEFTSSCKFTQLRYIILVIYEQIMKKSIVEIYKGRFDTNNNNNKEYKDLLYVFYLFENFVSINYPIFNQIIALNAIPENFVIEN